jgi:hypothetical protein
MQSVSYRLTAADLVDAGHYYSKRLLTVRAGEIMPVIVTFVWALIGAYLAYISGWDWNRSIIQSNFGLVGLPLIIGICFPYINRRWLAPIAARNQLKSNKELQGEIAVSWDIERIVVETDHGQSRWPWSDFYSWQESSGSMLLWLSNQSYFCLPKRAFSDSQISEIRANLTRVVGRPGKRRK